MALFVKFLFLDLHNYYIIIESQISLQEKMLTNIKFEIFPIEICRISIGLHRPTRNSKFVGVNIPPFPPSARPITAPSEPCQNLQLNHLFTIRATRIRYADERTESRQTGRRMQTEPCDVPLRRRRRRRGTPSQRAGSYPSKCKPSVIRNLHISGVFSADRPYFSFGRVSRLTLR